jgi:hypothetical protein
MFGIIVTNGRLVPACFCMGCQKPISRASKGCVIWMGLGATEAEMLGKEGHRSNVLCYHRACLPYGPIPGVKFAMGLDAFIAGMVFNTGARVLKKLRDIEKAQRKEEGQ